MIDAIAQKPDYDAGLSVITKARTDLAAAEAALESWIRRELDALGVKVGAYVRHGAGGGQRFAKITAIGLFMGAAEDQDCNIKMVGRRVVGLCTDDPSRPMVRLERVVHIFEGDDWQVVGLDQLPSLPKTAAPGLDYVR